MLVSSSGQRPCPSWKYLGTHVCPLPSTNPGPVTIVMHRVCALFLRYAQQNIDRHFVFRRHPLCPAVINRDMYGLKSDPRSVFFFLKNSRYGAERISVLAKTHGLLRSGFSALTMTRIRTERIIRTNSLSRIRTDLPEIVTERIGSDRISARGKCHGLSRSGYPPSKISRIFAERISVKRIFHGADYLTPSNKPHTPWDLSTVVMRQG